MKHQKIFTKWIEDHGNLIRHLIAGFESSPAVQEELFQEIALALWQAIPNYKKQANEKTYIARICQNRLATHVHKSVRQVSTQSIDISDDKIDPQECSYQTLEKQQRQQRLMTAVRKLPIDLRQVITLALEGMSYQEIAETLAISTNLVGVRLNRAKTQLHKQMVQP